MRKAELEAIIKVFGPKAKVQIVERTCKLVAEMGARFRTEGMVMSK